MTIVRTAKGTASNKGAPLTLTLNSVELTPRALLVVGLCYDDGSGPPVVKWGQRRLKPNRTVSGNGITTRIVSMVYEGENNRTRNIVATWTTTGPTAKVMFATMVEGGMVAEDKDAAQAEAATTDPDSGASVTPDEDEVICIGAFGSEGPGSDTVGTVQNGYTSGQRQGVAGAPPVSNVTIHEAYKILSASEATAAAKTGATSRDWCTVLVVFKGGSVVRHGITPSDYFAVVEIFETAGKDASDMVFRWNAELDRWEAYEIDVETLGTLVAHTAGLWTVI